MAEQNGLPAGLVYDRWLSSYFPHRAVYRLLPQQWLEERRSDASTAARDLAGWLQRPAFVFAKVPCREVVVVHLLEDAGLRVVDTAVTLQRTAAGAGDGATAQGYGVRFAADGDAEGVGRVAEESFVFSRFHLDPRIPDELANRIKRGWACNFFSGGRGDYMVVAESSGEIIGFNQLLQPAADTLVIDLIAVVGRFRRRGVAQAMIAFAAQHRCPRGLLRVGTQAANVPSVRLYERLGFELADAQYVLHHHGSA